RPSNTYGPGAPLVDQLEGDGPTWDRVARGLPVLVAGDGLGLWQSTHRDDCGRLFALAALNPRAYGQVYNAVRDCVFTWRDYYRQAAAAVIRLSGRDHPQPRRLLVGQGGGALPGVSRLHWIRGRSPGGVRGAAAA